MYSLTARRIVIFKTGSLFLKLLIPFTTDAFNGFCSCCLAVDVWKRLERFYVVYLCSGIPKSTT
jgi:hypothetical protein